MILVTGVQGQVGSALLASLQEASVAWGEVVGVGRDQFDLSKPDQLVAVLDQIRPKVILNAAAYTAVDLAEQEIEKAWAINAHAPEILAQWCAKNQACLVHYSTDYVFPGTGDQPWVESDSVGPLSVYGKSKLAGEQRIEGTGADHLIFRTSWVYDGQGKNFLRTMLKLGQERKELKIVADQHGAPTYAPQLAEATLQILRMQQLRGAGQPSLSGIYHLCHSGVTTWFEFAQAIFTLALAQGMPLAIETVLPIASAEYPTPAKRPHNSRLSTDKVFQTFGVRLPHWQEGLKQCMEQMV